MSLITSAPSAPAPVTPVTPAIQSIEAQSVVVDNSIIPRDTLGIYAEGAPVLTTWFSHVVSKDMGLYGHDASSSATYQQYKKINRLELRLQGDLQTTQDDKDKRFSMRGQAVMSAGIIPNKSDLFGLDIGDAREGIFEITQSRQLTLNAASAYEIEFRLLFISKTDTARRDDLESKVIATYHYVRDYARYGKDPIITDGLYYALDKLLHMGRNIASDYLRWFYSNESACLLVPGQGLVTYDPSCDAFLRCVVESRNNVQLQRARSFTIEADNYALQPTLWDALKERRYDLLTGSRIKLASIPTTALSRYPHMRSLSYSRIRTVVYPMPQGPSIDSAFNDMDFAYDVLPQTDMPHEGGSLQENERGEKPTGVVLTPLKNVHDGGYYVFSSAFYTGEGDLSLLEKLTRDFLNGIPVTPEHLVWLAENYRHWAPLHRYYYLPVVLLLIRSLVLEAV